MKLNLSTLSKIAVDFTQLCPFEISNIRSLEFCIHENFFEIFLPKDYFFKIFSYGRDRHVRKNIDK